jgi:DNA-3-methyladenine glycosylase I
MTETSKARCPWGHDPPIYRDYHDNEWGRPVVDDVRIYEKLCLEGFQSGLSWLTILNKRENFRKAFADFVPEVVAEFNDDDVARLLADAGIVRHRGKIEAAINNARCTLAVQADVGSLATLLWRYEPEPAPATDGMGSLPASTSESLALSKELRRRGFKFVGPTTVYSAMQALGLVNDHLDTCFARPQVDKERKRLKRP